VAIQGEKLFKGKVTKEREKMKKKQSGFSLIELLIVVAIILIIAAIAIPNLLRARMAANESSAVGSIRTINTSAVTYSSTWGVEFPASLAAMSGAPGGVAVCGADLLIDPVLGNATAAATAKSGYFFHLRWSHCNTGTWRMHGLPNLYSCGPARDRGTEWTARVLQRSDRRHPLHHGRQRSDSRQPSVAVVQGNIMAKRGVHSPLSRVGLSGGIKNCGLQVVLN
jgi:prepilin-type N-terminal cleavage/methylation domain-containing protein